MKTVRSRSRTQLRGLLVASGAGAIAVALTVSLTTAAQAATLFSDDFSGGTGSWSKSGGSWAVVTDGSAAYQQSNSGSERARVFAGSTSWSDYQIQARVKPNSFGSGGLVSIGARSSSATKMYRLALTGSRAELQMFNGSTVSAIGGASMSISTGSWYTLRIEASGSTIRGFVNGTQIASGSDGSYGSGRIALMTEYASATYDDVSVDTIGSTPPSTTPPGPTPTGPQPTTPQPTTPGPTSPPQTGLVGWATQNGGTTGGGSASATTVTNSSALSSAISGTTARVVRVSGTISCSGMLQVGSNKTILGNSGATISGCGLNISGQRNVIIRNLNFRGWDDDAINVQESTTNVWVDHNSFTDGYDGAVDIKRESDFITVSWNRIYGHDKSMLLGHSDSHTADRGHLRVTYHHNWFDGSGTRHPRVRFGNPVHVFNNYYYNNEYGVASTMGAGVLVEGNYFENVDEPTLVGYASSDDGAVVQRNNHFVGSGSPESGGGSVSSIPYSYQLASASSIKSTVTAGAGAGRINP
nr:right-handed parallel beta-helix repeat-containing protein [Micromonospora sp. DSM 115978]